MAVSPTLMPDNNSLEAQRLDLLRRGLVCVSLAADNVDRELDGQLAALRQLLRSNARNEDLAEALDLIEGRVRDLDDRRRAGQEGLRLTYERLSELLEPLAVRREDRRALKRFRKELDEQLDARVPAAALLSQFLAVADPVLRQVLDASAEVGLSLTDRLLGRVRPVKLTIEAELPELTVVPTPSSTPLAPDAAAAAGPAPSAASSWDVFEGAAVRDRIAGVLIGLLDQLKAGGALDEQQQRLHSRWHEGVDWPELPDALSETLHLIVHASTERQREYESFLLGLNARLGEVSQFLKRQHQDTDAARDSRDQMNASLSAQIDQMRVSVNGATSLGQLKDAILGQMTDIMGVMSIFQDREQSREQDLLAVVQAMAQRMTTMELEARQLRENIREEQQRAQMDGLTGLPNRSAWQERAEQEFSRWQRYGSALTLIVFDLDHFKPVNDTYGHLAGDKVLKLVARSLAKHLRETDFIARYGGEEFTVLLPETDLDGAQAVAEKLRLAVAECPFRFGQQPVPVTVSGGVSQFMPGDSVEAVFARADKALYQAKQAGRNAITVGI